LPRDKIAPHLFEKRYPDFQMSKLAADIARYKAKGNSGHGLWLNPAVWAIAFYRLGNWINVAKPAWVIRMPAKIVSSLGNKFCEVFMEMRISPRADIGDGLYIGHIGGVHIHPDAVIGRNCDISHNVTIGVAALGRRGVPVLGDNVYVGTGATLVGNIRIGSGVKVGANTLVISNVPAGATVMCAPGRVILAPRTDWPSAEAFSENDAERQRVAL
jgi:serine O-acetyltransferase